MSADLLSEFDAFYQDPRQAARETPPGASTVSFFDDLLSLDPASTSGRTTTNTTSTVLDTRNQYASWPHQSSEQPMSTATAATDQWGGFESFTTQAEHKSALAGTNPSKQADIDDQWGEFESFETAAAKPAPPISEFNLPFTSPQVLTVTNERYAGPSSLGSSQASKITAHPKARLPATPPKTSYAQFASNAQAWSNNRQRSSSLRNQVFPDPQPQRTQPANEVLFDAMAEAPGNDDEFGDFETSISPEPPQVSSRSRASSKTLKGSALSIDSLALSPTPSPYPKAPKSPSFKERNPFAGMSVSTKPAHEVEKNTNSPTPITAWPSFESPKPAPYKDSPGPEDGNGDWGDLIESSTKADKTDKTRRRSSSTGWSFPVPGTPEMPLKVPPKPMAPSLSTSIQDISHRTVTSQSLRNTPNTPFPSDPEPAPTLAPTPPRAPPPTNVPPPSILLSLFPSLFNLPQSSLIGPLSNRSTSVKSLVLANPSTISFLKAYLALATVAAHIIAARKLRWKRDTHLAQGTKIGPATRSGSGMKLTGVDRAETRREDREVAEVVRAWKGQLGPLRSAIVTAAAAAAEPRPSGVKGVTSNPLGPIPEITETPTIRTAPPSQGGLKAPRHCALCGLHRDERVEKVDVDVQDIFEEFWIEFWGHRTCRNFWEEHREKLAQR